MLAFLEIKEDVANGHAYMEYEGSWYGYEYCIIMDVHAGHIIFSFVNNYEQCVHAMDLHDFLNINWYKDYIKHVHEILYYNSIPLEIKF